MMISILFILLPTIILLGRLSFQAGAIWLITEEQIEGELSFKYNLKNHLFRWAEKFVIGWFCLLNIVTYNHIQKAAQTTLIQLQNHKFEG
ncbi:MAG: hypothetical protein Q4A76_01640 [Porphyromonadaceae bacterium]|nr:hypothetical protein [Porphyromonadaceae bacterium]